MHRFFCGPHAKKSAALAKQQKKKPKGKGKTVDVSGVHLLALLAVLCCAGVLCCAVLWQHLNCNFHRNSITVPLY